MTTLTRESKYRHIFKEEFTHDQSYFDINPDCFGESQHIKVNTKYWAVPIIAGGGGSFMIHDMNKTGRVERDHPLVKYHKAKILELEFSSFDQNIIASSSDDCTVRIKKFPEEIQQDIMEEDLCLIGHSKRVTLLNWHPTADNILASSGNDKSVIVWDAEKGEEAINCKDHDDIVYSISWNKTGKYIGSTSQDRVLRIFDPRDEEGKVLSTTPHENKKISKVFWMDKRNLIGSVGFTKDSFRELVFFDIRKISQVYHRKKIDRQNSKFYPYYEEANDILFISGKGDAGFRAYELTEQEGFCHTISELKCAQPHKGVAVLPRRAVDTTKGEILRLYRLQRNSIVPVSVCVPRRNAAMVFQEDLYPDCPSGKPAMTIDDYFDGKNESPLLKSMNTTKTAGATGAQGRRRIVRGAAKVEKNPVKKPETKVAKKLSSSTSSSSSLRKGRVEKESKSSTDASAKSEEVSKLTKKLQEMESLLKKKDNEIKEMKKTLEETRDEANQAGEKVVQLKNKLREMENKAKDSPANDNDEEKELLERKVKKLNRKAKKLRKELEDTEEVVSKQARKIKTLNKKLSEYE